MSKTGLDDLSFVPQSLDGFSQLLLEVIQTLTGEVLEFLVLQIPPDTFLGVQVRGIPWQRFNLDTLRFTGSQIRLERTTAMDGRSVPDQQEFAGNLFLQMLQKPDDAVAVVGFLLESKIEFACLGHGANH